MSLFKQTSTETTFGAVRFHPLREALIWIDAYREFSKLNKLDADALTDMGMSEAQRDAISVSQIAARMRG